MDKKIKVKELREAGLSYQQIGDLLGVSRQRIHQILYDYRSLKWYQEMRRDPEKLELYRKRKREYARDYRQSHPYKSRDYWRKNYLRVNGSLIKVQKRPRPDDVCEICDERVSVLHYHHWDDEHPEWGIWVCRRCHFAVEFVEKGLAGKYLELKEAISIL